MHILEKPINHEIYTDLFPILINHTLISVKEIYQNVVNDLRKTVNYAQFFPSLHKHTLELQYKL